MRHELLAKELVRSLRGRRSQLALSRRLKCRSNVLYLWESGRRYPDAGTFLDLARLTQPDLDLRLSAFLGEVTLQRLSNSALTKPAVSATELVCAWCEGQPAQVIAGMTGVHRVTVSSWLAGQTVPRLPEFLRLVDGTTRRLLEFVEVFVDPASLPSTRSAYLEFLAQRRLAYELPWSHAVLHALDIHAGVPRPEARIARSVGLDVSHVHALLSALCEAKVVRKRGSRYVKTRALTVDTRGDQALNFLLKRHWAQVGLERLEATRAQDGGLFSYNVFPLSQQDLQRLRELHAAYYDRVRQLVAGARGADHVVVLNLQLFPLEQVGPTVA